MYTSYTTRSSQDWAPSKWLCLLPEQAALDDLGLGLVAKDVQSCLISMYALVCMCAFVSNLMV